MNMAMNHGWQDISYERALARATTPVAALLDKALNGGELGFDDGVTLGSVAGDDLLAMVKTADELRRRTVGNNITYVVNRNLNFTNVCFVGCAFCGFSRGPKAKDAYFHSTETLVAKSQDAAALGATEVCIQGGLPRDLNGGYYAQLLRDIHAALPELHLHAFSPMEISYGVEKTGLSLTEHLISLKEAGIGSIPGTAAEILDDEVRGDLSPNKLKVSRWIEVIRTAHGLGIPSTSTMMYGHTEQPEALGAPHAAAARHPKGHGRFSEFGAARLYPLRDAAIPQRSCARRRHIRRASDRARAGAASAQRSHPESASVVGQAGIPARTCLFAGRRQ